MNTNDRFLENEKTVLKIAKLFGLELVGFNPDWEFRAPNNEDGATLHMGGVGFGYPVTDDMMGKLAILLGFDWVFERDEGMLLALIREHEIRIEREEEFIKRFKEMHQKLGIEEESLESSYREIKGLKESIGRLVGVLKTRMRLKMYMRK